MRALLLAILLVLLPVATRAISIGFMVGNCTGNLCGGGPFQATIGDSATQAPPWQLSNAYGIYVMDWEQAILDTPLVSPNNMTLTLFDVSHCCWAGVNDGGQWPVPSSPVAKVELNSINIQQQKHVSGQGSALQVTNNGLSQGDTVGINVEAMGAGGNFASGDEGVEGVRSQTNDNWFTPRSALSQSLSPGNTTMNITGMTNALWPYMGGSIDGPRYAVFTDATLTQAVTITGYSSGTWTTQAAMTGTPTNFCFSLNAAAYNDLGAFATNMWLPIESSADSTHFVTQFFSQGTDIHAPSQMYPGQPNVNTALTQHTTLAGTLAPCEAVVGYSQAANTVTINAARNTIPSAHSTWHMPAIPPSNMSGVYIVVDAEQGMGISRNGLSITNTQRQPGISRQMNAGINIFGGTSGATDTNGNSANGFQFGLQMQGVDFPLRSNGTNNILYIVNPAGTGVMQLVQADPGAVNETITIPAVATGLLAIESGTANTGHMAWGDGTTITTGNQACAPRACAGSSLFSTPATNVLCTNSPGGLFMARCD